MDENTKLAGTDRTVHWTCTCCGYPLLLQNRDQTKRYAEEITHLEYDWLANVPPRLEPCVLDDQPSL
jgi:hypothetical protein